MYLWSRLWYSPRCSCGSAPAGAARSHCPRPAASRGPTRTPGRPSCERLNSSSSRVSMAGKSINSQPTSHLKNTEKQHLFFYFLFSKQEKLVISLFLQYSNIIIPIIVSMFLKQHTLVISIIRLVSLPFSTSFHHAALPASLP